MVTWRDILHSLRSVEHSTDECHLDDAANIMVDGELVNIDVLLVNVDEIQDDRLLGLPANEIETTDFPECP